jgi:hypothetical protein
VFTSRSLLLIPFTSLTIFGPVSRIAVAKIGQILVVPTTSGAFIVIFLRPSLRLLLLLLLLLLRPLMIFRLVESI